MTTDGRVRRAGALLRSEWDRPDQYDSITTFMTDRGLLMSARRIMAGVATVAGLVPLTELLGQRSATAALLAAQSIGIVLTAVMAVCWWRRWPTRRQSRFAVLLGLSCIAVWSQAQSNAALAAQICMATAITGGYVGFLHSNKLLALNFGVSLTIDVLTVLRLERQTGTVNAIGSLWLMLFIELSVPLAISGISRATWVYASRCTEDPLTGLLNRRAFTDTLVARLAGRATASSHLTVLVVDLDNFKRINDTHGHASGDHLLMAVADVLRRQITGSALVCRSGGEEFLIADTGAISDPVLAAERICTAIATLSPAITASIGITDACLSSRSAPATIDSISRLIDTADTAMYVAKRDGGDHAHYARHAWDQHDAPSH